LISFWRFKLPAQANRNEMNYCSSEGKRGKILSLLNLVFAMRTEGFHSTTSNPICPSEASGMAATLSSSSFHSGAYVVRYLKILYEAVIAFSLSPILLRLKNFLQAGSAPLFHTINYCFKLLQINCSPSSLLFL
jgi:hypothetical protein